MREFRGALEAHWNGNLPALYLYLGRLAPGKTQRIAREVAQAVALWQNEVVALGLNAAEIDRMASAFEHDDLRAARRGS